MTLYCEKCKKDTLHRNVTEESFPGDPFTYKVCDDCEEIYLPLFGLNNEDKKKKQVQG
jgi:hypothetical protein